MYFTLRPILYFGKNKSVDRCELSLPGVSQVKVWVCVVGLSEEVRSDFHVMKDLATHTRIAPEGRYQTLSNFIEKINK